MKVFYKWSLLKIYIKVGEKKRFYSKLISNSYLLMKNTFYVNNKTFILN